MGRHFDGHAHVEIAMAVPLHIPHPLALEPEQGAVLCAGWNFDLRLARQGRDLQVGAEGGLNKADWDFAKQVVAIALEDLVWFDMQYHIQNASRSATQPGLAIAD